MELLNRGYVANGATQSSFLMTTSREYSFSTQFIPFIFPGSQRSFYLKGGKDFREYNLVQMSNVQK